MTWTCECGATIEGDSAALVEAVKDIHAMRCPGPMPDRLS